MRTIIQTFIGPVILFFAGCNKFYRTDSEFEQRDRFDTITFHKNRTSIEDAYSFTVDDSILVKQFSRFEDYYKYSYHEFRYYNYKGNYIYELYTYNPDAIIYNKVRMHGEALFKIGKEYFYDEKGKVMKVIDHEKPFTFTIEDVYRFVDNHFQPLHKIKRYAEGTNRPHWVVTFEAPADTSLVYAFYLDGKTGEVFKENIPVERTAKLTHPLKFMKSGLLILPPYKSMFDEDEE